MACLLIVDDNTRNSAVLARLLSGGLDDISHRCICVQDLQDFRKLRAEIKPDLILVELLRHQGNGFTLAAAFSRLSIAPVVLLTDRDVTTDLLWARARGISAVLSRRHGAHDLLCHIRHLLGDPGQFESASASAFTFSTGSGPVIDNTSLAALSVQAPEPAGLNAVSCLRRLCLDMWLDIAQSTCGASDVRQQCRSLQHAIQFLPEPLSREESIDPDTDIGLQNFVQLGQMLRLSGTDNANSRLPVVQLISRECEIILRQSRLKSGAGWRYMARLCLVLHNLGFRGVVSSILLDCLSVLYSSNGDLPGRQSAAEPAYLHVCLQQLLNISPEVSSQYPVASSPCLPADISLQLLQAVREMLVLLASEQPRHHIMCQLMVSLYKLRVWLEMLMMADATDQSGLQPWRVMIGGFYEFVCLEVRGHRSATAGEMPDYWLRQLIDCAGRNGVPSEQLLFALAAVETNAVIQSGAEDRVDQQLLASGLCILPAPESILANLQDDQRQFGPYTSELMHELHLLLEGARQFKVLRVESLTRIMLDCYQHIQKQPQLLQQKKIRLALGRAHRRLCRMLDQAAAWQSPAQESGLSPQQQSLAHLVDELFTAFDADDGELNRKQSVCARWQQCYTINRRIRKLLRRSINLQDYQGLIADLLHQQQLLLEESGAVSIRRSTKLAIMRPS